MKILHVITSLDVGGAELVLAQLVKSLQNNAIENTVVCLLPAGKVADQLSELNVRVVSLNITSALGGISGFFKLVSLIKCEKPDVIQSWLYHANFLASVAAFFTPVKKVVWGIHSNQKVSTKRSTSLLIKAGAWLSRFSPKKIVYVAVSSKAVHESLGYNTEPSVVIPNGFNVDLFRPDGLDKQSGRAKLNIPTNKLVIGCVGRWHPDKGLDIMLQVIADIQLAYADDIFFVFAGRDCTAENTDFFTLQQKCPKPEYILALGECDNVPELLSALDIFCLPSRSEAFPLALGEAMASGLYCIATDVGDVRYLTGDLIDYALPDDTQSLKTAIITALRRPEAERKEIAKQLHQRVNELFSEQKTTLSYIRLYQQLLS
ncbi:glycosyltransferase [Rheinheimera aquimaris]|uniref:glycosyltransferase n=1 Tax=Rheinheimera aquimaris TaxID=412437 RepID=UPI001E354AF5|nr:glycosyltransferase [Rheinheimera aquimaris]MCD1599829.1 glycosyltransferase [Rheinheimera aquimaris]